MRRCIWLQRCTGEHQEVAIAVLMFFDQLVTRRWQLVARTPVFLTRLALCDPVWTGACVAAIQALW